MTQVIDPAFAELTYRKLASLALAAAAKQGASYADFRFERQLGQSISIRNMSLERFVNSQNIGYAVRVIVNGGWGFAASFDMSERGVRRTVEQSIEVARVLGVLNSEPVELAPEPTYTGTYVSSYEQNPFEVADAEKIEFLTDINKQVLASGKVDFVDFGYHQVLENKYFQSSEGTDVTQQRVRLLGNFEAVKIDKATGAFETMRSGARPVGKGWEYMADEHSFAKDAAEIPDLLEQKISSKSVVAGKYDLVIDPSNLWLTIHESIGHATELDRVLGYEANYAGTSFATLDKLNKLQYGSEIMNVTGDRTTQHGLSTIGYDDEGVAGQQWDLIKDGKLVGYQLNRQMAQKQGFGRSNGCAFADSPGHVPLQRMANVSLQPGRAKMSLDDLIGKVDKGIYIVGDKSWSIDMQRYNFQFTGQRFYEIKNGKIVGQLRDVAYQAVTTEFWNSMEAVGDETTYVLGGAANCGKGQPGQVAPVSHGCPVALFRQVKVLNATSEAVS